MKHIRIKPHFSVIAHSQDNVELKQGVWNSFSHTLTDDNKEGVLAKIVLGLQTGKNPADIAKEAAVNRSKVEAVIDYLQQLGVLQSQAESFIDYYVEQVATSLKQAGKFKYEALRSVVLVGDEAICLKIKAQLENLISIEVDYDKNLFNFLESMGDNWLFDALEQAKVLENFLPWQGKFLVMVNRHINPPLATRINRIAYELNILWLHLALDGPFIFIGPCFAGKTGPCYDCFEKRVHMNLRESENYQKYKNALLEKQVQQQTEDPLCDVTANILISHGILEILNYLTTEAGFTTNKILSIFLPTMEFVYHELLRLPACRTCGSIPYRDDTQIYFDFQKLLQEDNL